MTADALSDDVFSDDPLRWLSHILWPDDSVELDRAPAGPALWWASPSADRPKILIPARSSAAARTAVTRYHDGFGATLRARSLAAETLMGSRRLASLVLGRQRVGLSPVAPDAPDAGVPAAIARLLGVDELHIAVSLSTPKSNRKPVLQLLGSDGHCLGWAKIGWNGRTDALVANEAYWLQRSATDPGRLAPLVIPTVLHDEVLCGRRVVITSGVRPARLPRRRPGTLPDLDLFRAVAELGSNQRLYLSDSGWWESVTRVLDHADPRERRAIEAALESVGDRRFRLGAWHGDLTPWNMMSTRDTVQVIDWEFAADGVPIGFDLCHFHTQVGVEMRSATPAQALDRSARLSPQGLAQLGVAAENRGPIWRLYLVELIRRFITLRASGYPTENLGHGPAALNRLERALNLSGGQIDSSRPADQPDRNSGPTRTTRPAASTGATAR